MLGILNVFWCHTRYMASKPILFFGKIRHLLPWSFSHVEHVFSIIFWFFSKKGVETGMEHIFFQKNRSFCCQRRFFLRNLTEFGTKIKFWLNFYAKKWWHHFSRNINFGSKTLQNEVPSFKESQHHKFVKGFQYQRTILHLYK